MRLIDADRLKAEIMGWRVATDDLFGMGKYHERKTVLQAIEESPSVDAVQVCRCRDCIHFRAKRLDNGEPTIYVCCRTNGYSDGENHFCAWGEQSTVPMRYRYTVDCISYYDGEEEPFPCD